MGVSLQRFIRMRVRFMVQFLGVAYDIHLGAKRALALLFGVDYELRFEYLI